ncbi:hypothetical protein H4R34_000040 [Dimargaris verticillata]|uniref:Histidine kinase/HSP90-like ATPase domain-containing protein n=1 Tax=Dimargaris verticillata TaxID=2761393 RepID=A0A9W8BDE0_9FUNG|nr:hypothetical protein H4R34_000040 [Dimargaris verticillata]
MRHATLTIFTLAAIMAGAWAQAADTPSVSTAVAAASTPAFDAAPLDLTDEQQKRLESASEKHQFDAEVPRLMNLIINSVYKNKEVFLRELISNASDALDKVRHEALVDSSIMEAKPELNISIRSYPEKNMLVIRDTGIGMTKEQLREHLGTIAKSGTAEYMKHLEKKGTEGGSESDVNELIGQFGVGFYSAFLVADKVSFATKHPSEAKQHVWTSTGGSDFAIYEDLPENDLGRGSAITLHFKEEDAHLLSSSKLKDLVEKHSSYISFPIYLWSATTETIEVPADEVQDSDKDQAADDLEEEAKEDQGKAEKEDTDADSDSDNDAKDEPEVEDEDDEDKDSNDADQPKTTTKTIEKEEWVQVNAQKPIWLRDPKTIITKEYNDFYQSFAKDTEDPLAYNHFKGEGKVNFRGIIFVPPKQPSDYLQSFQAMVNNVKLYVKRVFITEELGEFLPKYLNFVRVLVDAEDLPLNVSREMLQNTRELHAIKKTITRKAIDMFSQLAENDPEQYQKFLDNFGANIRLGINEDHRNQARLAKLLRFASSHADSGVSFADYVSRMKGGQKQIYYVAAPTLQEAKKSPYVETLLARGYEVLFLTEQLDEYSMQALREFDGKMLRNVAQSGLEFGDEDDETKAAISELKKEYDPLVQYLGEALSDHIERAVISNRLTKSPMAIAANQFGWSGTMERFMKAQTRGKDDFMTSFMLNQKKVLEVNPHHPIIKGMLARVGQDKDDKHLKLAAEILYETAAIQSGYDIKNANTFARKIESFMRKTLDVDDNAEAEVDVKPAPERSDEDDEKEEGEEEIDAAGSEDSQQAQDDAEASEDKAEEAPEPVAHDEL